MAAAARDISQASLSRDNLTAVAARSVPATVTRSQQPLPTPPNSISPNLPPHGLKAQLQKAKLEPIDSDLDLHEPSDRRRSISPGLEASGAITGSLLAKYHLPEILLNHGPLAIRHIMGWGWGRWDARKRGQPSRHRQGTPPSSYGAGIPIGNNGGRGQDRPRLSIASSNGDSVQYSHDDNDIYMMEHEADKMSMDGSGSASCSEAPDDDVVMNDDPEDATDDEDWATMGAAALRAESYPNQAAAQTDHGFRSSSAYAPGGLRSFSASSGMARPPQTLNIDFSALAGTSDAQEREAVEALLQLGSV
ncbi:Sin3 binding protein [Fusarium oxysporum f. sp. vasinfectum]|nr:Sin3 binding protein [Fusarium oxysporum f. sp. vasinfectum]